MEGGRRSDHGASVLEGGELSDDKPGAEGAPGFESSAAARMVDGAPGDRGAADGASVRCESSADGGRIANGGASVLVRGVLGDDGGRSDEGTSVCAIAGAALEGEITKLPASCAASAEGVIGGRAPASVVGRSSGGSAGTSGIVGELRSGMSHPAVTLTAGISRIVGDASGISRSSTSVCVPSAGHHATSSL